MFKNLFLTFFILFSSFITIYPSKKENTNLFDYCYCLEKILSRNSLEESKNLSKKVQSFAKKRAQVAFFGIWLDINIHCLSFHKATIYA